MKHTFILFFLGCVAFSIAQTKPIYIDSLEQVIENRSAKQQLKAINEIPYGDFVAEVEKAEKLFKKAENLAIKLNDSLTLGEIVFKQSQLNAYKNKLDESLAFSLRAINIFESLKNDAKAGMVYGGLGYNLKSKNLAKGLNYMRKGIKLLEGTNDLEGINPIYDNYGLLLSMANKKDSALFYQNKSLLIKKQLKDSVGLGYGYANIANTLAENKNYILAKKYVDSSSIIRNKLADNYGITVNYVIKAEIFVLEKKFLEAIDNFNTCAKLANKYKYRHLEQYCYESLSKSYLELKDYKNAFYFKEKFQILKDSSDNVVTNIRVEELQIEFETEKKEKQLAEAKVELLAKEAKIKKRTTFLISALALAFLFGLIGFLVYKQQRLKNEQIIKENELRQALIKIENQNNLQEQRLAISKDLHDNIGSQLTFIISSLDNLKYFEFTKDKLYSKFDSIGTFTRSTITDLRDTIWAMNKEAITFEDLKTRTTNFIEAAKTSLLGITFEFNYPKDTSEVTLNSLQGIDVYRIIQEAVNNAVKHANATKISVDFTLIKNTLEVSITDNGKGFDKESVEAGNGLNSMKKRAQEIEADFSIEPLEQGTKVRLEFQLQ